jgi:hypothetical protein
MDGTVGGGWGGEGRENIHVPPLPANHWVIDTYGPIILP